MAEEWADTDSRGNSCLAPEDRDSPSNLAKENLLEEKEEEQRLGLEKLRGRTEERIIQLRNETIDSAKNRTPGGSERMRLNMLRLLQGWELIRSAKLYQEDLRRLRNLKKVYVSGAYKYWV